MQSILDAMAQGMFANALLTTATEGAGSHANVTPESLMEAFKKLERIDEEWERDFNAVAIKTGFDFNKGDWMCVSKGYNLNGVPPRYRAQVHASDMVMPGTACFIQGATLNPFRNDSPTWRV